MNPAPNKKYCGVADVGRRLGPLMAVLFLQLSARAELPAAQLKSIFPPAGRVGTSLQITCEGRDLDEASGIHFSAAGISSKLVRSASTSAIFEVTIAPEVPPGIYEARVAGRHGISNSRAFLVGLELEMPTPSTNKTADSAQPLNVGGALSARCVPEASAYFNINLVRGSHVRFECLTRQIDSQMLPVMLLSDPLGHEVARSRQGGNLGFVAPHDGRYTLQIHDLLFRGGPEYFYHLAVTAAGPEVCPHERGGGALVELPCEGTGHFQSHGQANAFEFTARKGDVYWIEIVSDRLGIPTAPDLLLQAVNAGKKGKPARDLREVNGIDGPPEFRVPDGALLSRDVAFPFEVNETGTYRLVARDLFNTSGQNDGPQYRLSIRRPVPDFVLRASQPPVFADAQKKLQSASAGILLRNGGCVPIQLSLYRRDGLNEDVMVEAEGLPPGVSGSGIIPAGQNTGVLLLCADDPTASWSGAVRLVGRARWGEEELAHEAQYDTTIWGATEEQPAVNRVAGDFAVAVSTEPEPLSIGVADDRPLRVKANGKLHVPLKLTARGEIKSNLKLHAAGLPELDALPVATVDPKQAQPAIDLEIGRRLPPGSYTVYLKAEATIRHAGSDQPATFYSRPLRFEVDAVPGK